MTALPLLLRLIDEPGLRASLSAAGLADAERFSVAAMARRYERVYEAAALSLMRLGAEVPAN